MKICILGAGIGGLSAAYHLRNSSADVKVFEASHEVGGLARSFRWNGFCCDLAPHRLYTNDQQLLAELKALVPMNRMRRRSRIFIQGKWIQDPVNAAEILLKFFPFKSFKLGWHYLFREKHAEDNFEALVLNKFGKGLNAFFFKPYSEKLFGIPASEISPEWGRKKIRVAGLKDMLRRNTKLYFKTFHYPRRNGYGAICDRLHREVESLVQTETPLVAIEPRGHQGYRCTFERKGQRFTEEFDHVVSSLPASVMAGLLGTPVELSFRPADIHFLHIDKPQVSDNHWFYFADSDYSLNRVSEFKNFSSQEMPEETTVLCCEVTRTENTDTDRVIRELVSTGLFRREDVLDTKVIRLEHAYPIYDLASESERNRAEATFARHPGLSMLGRHAQFAHQDVDEIYAEARRVVQDIPGIELESQAAVATGQGRVFSQPSLGEESLRGALQPALGRTDATDG